MPRHVPENLLASPVSTVEISSRSVGSVAVVVSIPRAAISSGASRFGGYGVTVYSSAFMFSRKLCPRSQRTMNTLLSSSTYSTDPSSFLR